MRILHILHTSLPYSCGYSIRSDRILQIQRDLGMEVAVVTSARQPDGAAEGTIDGIQYWRTPSPRLWPSPIREIQLVKSLARKVTDVVEKVQPDIVHAHSPILVGLPAYRVARATKTPLVYEVRDLWENAWVDHGYFRANSAAYRLARNLETFLLKRADAVVTLCESLREELEPRRGQSVTVAFNGVDPDRFVPVNSQPEWQREWNPAGRQLICYIGSFQPYEGLETLVEAMPRVLQSNGNVHLLIVGDGPSRNSLEDRVRKIGLDNRITFAGRIPHERVQEVYAVADLLVYPRVPTRTTELTTPLKTLEAMAMGKAVLASDLKPLRELVADGHTGILFAAGQVDDLADKAAALLSDPDLRTRLGQNGREWVSSERRWADSVARYSEVYSRVLESHNG